MDIILLDTETTGVEKEARIVELAYKNLRTGKTINEFFKPPIPITIGAMATHHITPKMVSDKPYFDKSEYHADLKDLLKENILVAHNALFDMNVLLNEGIGTDKYIDTLRLSKHLVRSESYSMQYLRYLLDFDVSGMAHSALGDVNVLEALFCHLRELVIKTHGGDTDDAIVLKMMELTKTPVQLERIDFGKYKGRRFDEILLADRGYLEWLYNNEYQREKRDQNEDILYTLEKVFKRN